MADPNLRTGQGVYHRTQVIYQSGSTFKFTEIGWAKSSNISGRYGVVVFNNGISRDDYAFQLPSGTHSYAQYADTRYTTQGVYNYYVDGTYLGFSSTVRFVAGTTVACGGEVISGVEAMGNVPCYANQKAYRGSDGRLYLTAWGGHTNYVDNYPYRNVNSSSDPKNAFYSTGNE